jgi:hypothetical protein
MKLALVCVLVALVATSASALPNYIWNVGGYDSAGLNGNYTFFGKQNAASTTAMGSGTNVQAFAASLAYTGGLDTSIVKTANYSKFFVSQDQSRYILNVWAASQFAGETIDVRVWAGTATAAIPANGWRLYKLYDPITDTWGKTELSTSPIMATSNGSAASPWFKAALPVFRTGDPLGAKNGYILSLEQPVPEPGSMVAMLSGLVGLVGFGIRRRK